MKIYAPVKDADGIYASVRFIKGVGETNNPALIEWFRKHGYRIENVADNGKIEKSVENSEISIEKCENSPEIHSEKCDKPDFESMTSDEIRTWAKANGLGGVIKNTRNKEKLIELIRG